jgi:hypothetical protein
MYPDITEGLQAKLLFTFVYQKYSTHAMVGGEPSSNLGQIIPLKLLTLSSSRETAWKHIC